MAILAISVFFGFLCLLENFDKKVLILKFRIIEKNNRNFLPSSDPTIHKQLLLKSPSTPAVSSNPLQPPLVMPNFWKLWSYITSVSYFRFFSYFICVLGLRSRLQKCNKIFANFVKKKLPRAYSSSPKILLGWNKNSHCH